MSTSWADFSSKVKSAKATSAGKGEREEQKGRQRLKEGSEDHKKLDEVLGRRVKKLPAFLRPSPNVGSRSDRHDGRTTSTWAKTPSSQLEQVKASLERKAKLYDQLRQGKTGGLNEERLQDSLVDWSRKEVEDSEEEEEEEEEKEEEEGGDDGAHGSNAKATSDEDEMTEYEDEFGRHRRVRRSEVPRYAVRAEQRKQEVEYDDSLVTYGPATSFPVFTPDPGRRRKEEDGLSDGYKRAAADHFDSRSDKRYRGAGFYQFSQDEGKRSRQMDELRQARRDTTRQRDQPTTG